MFCFAKLYPLSSIMKCNYSVLVRFSNEARKDDFVKDFADYEAARDYFRFLVSLDFDGLLSSYWYVAVRRMNKVILSYSKY